MEKHREGDGLIFDHVEEEYICVLCPPSESTKLTVDHRITKEHVTRLRVFKTAFGIRNEQPWCTQCRKGMKWQEVKKHAESHEITPFWSPPDKTLKLFANHVTRTSALYHCHLCDRAMSHWSDAWSHLNDLHEGYLELQEKAGAHELEKKWNDHFGKWHRQGITPGPNKQLQCRICEVTMEPDKADRHIELSDHEQRKLLYDKSLEKRLKSEELIRSGETPQIPNSAVSSASLKSERVGSSHGNDSDDRVSIKSFATESSSTQENDSVTKKQRAEYHSLVVGSSWVTETKHPQFEINFTEDHRENWPKNVAQQSHFCLLCRKDLASMKSVKKHKSSSEHVNSLKKYGTDYLIVTEQGSFFCTCCENLRTPLWLICSHIMTVQHLETIKNINLEKTVEAENKSKESESIDNVKSQQCSAAPDRCLTGFSQEIEPSGEKAKPLGKNSRANDKPPVSSVAIIPTIDPAPSVEPKIASAVAKKSANFATQEMNLNWIFATSDALFSQLISSELRRLPVITITRESSYCVICFQEFSDMKDAKDHISGERHINVKKIYGCDFIARTEQKGYYCKCCDKKEQQLDKIYNHLLSSSHAQRVTKKNKQINSTSQSDQAKQQPKKSETKAKNSDQSSSEPKKVPASESNEKNSKISNRQPNWIVGPSSSLDKNLVPKNIHKSLTDETRKEFLYCFVCSKSFFKKEIADKHLSSAQHLDSMKKSGFDLIVMNKTGQYDCACCNQPVGQHEQMYRHPLTKKHIKHLLAYNQRNRQLMDNKNSRDSSCEKVTQPHEQAEFVVENLPKTIEPENQLRSNVCPVNSGQSSEPKKSDLAKKKEKNPSFFETNWIIKVSDAVYKRVVPNSRREDCPINGEKTCLYCLLCLEYLSGIEDASVHISSNKHVKSMKRYGCHCIEKISPTRYVCRRCERETNSLKAIYNHLTSRGHASRAHVVAEVPKKSDHVKSNAHPTSEDLQTVSTNSRSSRDNSCRTSESQSVTPGNFEFLDTDLSWIVDFRHPLFPRWAIKSIEKEMTKKITKKCCIICSGIFSKIETAQKHITTERHKNTLKRLGCNYIEVTQQSTFRCTCCSSKEMTFTKIHAHINCENHDKKLREIEREDRDVLLNSESYGKKSKTAPTSWDFGYPESAWNWLINRENSIFKNSLLERYGKPAKNTSQGLFYCPICDWPCDDGFMDVDETQEHIASSSHASSIERYGCDQIEFGPDFTYRCKACDSHTETVDKIFSHVTSNAHFTKLCLAIGKKERKVLKESSETTTTESLMDQSIEADSEAKEESNNSVPSNVIEIDSRSSLLPEILPTPEITAEVLVSLQGDFPWVHVSYKKAKKLNPENFDVTVDNGTSGERFHCSLCLTIFYGAKAAIDHLSDEQHAKSLNKYGCQYILNVKISTYFCTCCNRKRPNFRRMQAHVMSDSHRDRLRRLNPGNAKPPYLDCTKNESSTPVNLTPIEETPSQSRNSFPRSFLGTDALRSLDEKTCPEAEKTVENVIFFARDLDWVIDRFDAMFSQRTVKKPHEKLASHTGAQLFHCLVCFADFPDAQTTKNHISSEQHKQSLLRFGCHEIRVTPQLNYRCGVCQHETKLFLSIYGHVMSDQHAKRLGGGSQRNSLPVCAEKKPRAVENDNNKLGSSFWDTGEFSFNWPAPQEKYTPFYEKLQSSRKSSPDRSDSDDELSRNFPKINSAPSTRRIPKKPEQHFELRDEDLNWVVGSNHRLYKAKPSKSPRAQSFYCLLCSLHFSGIEAAVIHISSEDHAHSIKQFGCNFIQLTPDLKFHCACCNHEKNRFDKIYAHIVSETHMNRICEVNQETDDRSPVEIVAKESSDFETHGNDIDQSFSENSDLCSTGRPTFSEKPSSLNEEATSSLEISSCLFATKRSSKKSYCHICESFEIRIATKNLESHINSMRHKFSLKRHGCENIETREDGSYYCACCDYEMPNLQNVYLHIKDKKHMSSLVKVKQESRRVKKATRAVSPANRFKTTGKPLLSEFIVKKICEPDEIADDDSYEPLEGPRQNLLPRYTGNIKKDLEKLNSISGQLPNLNQPLLNSMLITMADKLSQLTKQIADSNESALPDQSIKRKRWIFEEPSVCKICKARVSTLEALHAHMAKHISEELASAENSHLRKHLSNETVTGSHERLPEFSDPENSESGNPLSDSQRNRSTNQNSDPQSSLTLDDPTDVPKSNQSSCSFDDSSSAASDGELGQFEDETSKPVWDREQYSKDAMKEASSRKIDLEKVLLELEFKDNYIYKLKDKLEDLKMGSRMLLVIDKETIHCLVCRERVKNTIKDYSAHLWSLDHCAYLDLMEKDAAAFKEFPDQLSDLDLAHEFMEEISSEAVRCYLCNRDVENETEALRDHIYDDAHEHACASTRSNGLAIFQTLKHSVKCDWYGIQQYTCLACNIRCESEVHFVKHLNGRKHSKNMLRSPNVENKMLFDYCATCALLWYGYRSSFSYHVSEVDIHDWLKKDGFYLSNEIRKEAKLLLQHPEDDVERLIRHLDAIKFDEKSKEDSPVDDLQKIVRSTFPRAKAYTFGSRVTGLNSVDSDIDIFLDCRNVYSGKGISDTRYFIDQVFKCLTKYPERWDIREVLTRCRSPIIRVDHRPTGLACDISFDNGLTVEKTKFIKRIVEVYPMFRKLVLILRMWMAHCNLSGSERISHNSLYWLVVFFLQNEKILPSIAYLITMKGKSHIIAGWEVGVSYDFGYFEPDRNTSVTELLQRFFIFYANFDFRFKVVCPLLGRAIQKRNFVYPEQLPKEMRLYVKQVTKLRNVEMFRIDSPMCIQDPFDLLQNTTKATGKEILNQFRTGCLKSVYFMASL